MADTPTKSNRAQAGAADAETMAQILEGELRPLIHDGLSLVETQEDLMAIPLTGADRTGHLPQLLAEVIARLRLPSSVKVSTSLAAGQHGDLRRKQGYSVAMLVEESRILQICLFTTLHKNATRLDYELLLDVATIADEMDAQLKLQTLCDIDASAVRTQPRSLLIN